jgi:D-alanine-D-alanine ligase
MRVRPIDQSGRFVYSLEAKRDWERLCHNEIPAALSPGDMRAVNMASMTVWKILGCRDLARIDFRLRNHVPYFLEANPLPGLSPKSSDLVHMARALGIGHQGLIAEILKAASDRLAAAPIAAKC